MSSVWIAVGVLSVLSLLFGSLLGFASRRFRVENDPITDQIDALLPQSQCGQCGYPGCRPYADAVGYHNEAINKCAPGGEKTMLKIAGLLGVEPQPPDGENSAHQPERKVALIDEASCIGCTKCIHACPVDAIVGSAKAMHTVIGALCTGCNLCVAPCPTDCIEMHPVPATPANWKWKWKMDTIPLRIISADNYV